MKHAQKMVITPEHLSQSVETERRLTAPVQLPTLTRLDQDMPTAQGTEILSHTSELKPSYLRI